MKAGEIKDNMERAKTLDLYEFADTFVEQLLRVKEVIDKPEFELPNEKKQSLINVVKFARRRIYCLFLERSSMSQSKSS